MAKTLTIQIKPDREALESFRQTFKTLQAGRRVHRREGVYFTSVEAARNLLTPTRLHIERRYFGSSISSLVLSQVQINEKT